MQATKAKPLTNTERLIKSLEHAIQFGHPCIIFAVGRYTGNGVAVVEALRRRGYVVERNPGTCPQSYTLGPKPNQPE